MAAANNEFFEALSMLEHERGITAEYLIEKIKAAIIIAVKKNYEVEEDHVKVDIDPAAGRFDVALIQDVVADEDWYDEHSEIGITEAQKIRKSYEVGDRIVTPLKTKDFGRIAARRRASLLWIWARAARLSCPTTSRCPARCTPRARPCRSTLWTWSALSAAPAL